MSEDKMMKQAITVDDGSRRVPILNVHGEEIGVFHFHPTDIGIIQRFNELAGAFDSITEPLEAVSGSDGEAVDIADPKYAAALKEAGDRLYGAVDALFGGAGAAEAFFGNMHPFSPVNGEFYCTQVLNAVGAYIGAAFDTETARFSDRARKYARKAEKRH